MHSPIKAYIFQSFGNSTIKIRPLLESKNS
jgi:hypothetical protein